MNIGTQILKIRKEKALTQERGENISCYHRQTVSNWENEKSVRICRFAEISKLLIFLWMPYKRKMPKW